MTMHLSSQEFVDALDGELPAARQTHLQRCAACQAQVQELRALVHDAGQDAVAPEPSPLFWDHFQSRVLEAVQADDRSAPRAWWNGWVPSRPLVALAAAAIVIAAGAAVYLNPSAPVSPSNANGPVTEAGVVADATAPVDNDEWEFVASVMGTLDADDIHQVLTPSSDAVDAAIETLSAVERETLMKLLKAEMGQGLE